MSRRPYEGMSAKALVAALRTNAEMLKSSAAVMEETALRLDTLNTILQDAEKESELAAGPNRGAEGDEKA